MVVDNQWLSPETFIDLVTISETTPGPIAINAATFVGTVMAGLPGAIIATVGVITPSFIIVLILAWFYYRYRKLDVVRRVLNVLQPAVVALIAAAGMRMLITAIWGAAGFSLALGAINWLNVFIFAAALLVLRRFKPSPIVVMLGTGIFGLITHAVSLIWS